VRVAAHADSDYDIPVFLEDLTDRWREFHRLADLGTALLAEAGAFLEARPFRAGSYRDRTADARDPARRRRSVKPEAAQYLDKARQALREARGRRYRTRRSRGPGYPPCRVSRCAGTDLRVKCQGAQNASWRSWSILPACERYTGARRRPIALSVASLRLQGCGRLRNRSGRNRTACRSHFRDESRREFRRPDIRVTRENLVVAGAAVDVDRLAGDEAAAVADQKQAGGGDFVDVALTTERDPGALGTCLRYQSGLSRRVSMLPRETALARMFWPANSEARPRANPTRPILATET